MLGVAMAVLAVAMRADGSPSAEADARCAPAAGFVGTICAPGLPGRRPTVLVLGGSGGGDRLAPVARRFAEHGYVGASVAYFGIAPLPRTLDEIPVETVGTAIDALIARDDVDPHRIAVFGDSKGGELALLAASTYPALRAVVGLVPSPFAWSGMARGASWTLGGRPVRYVQVDRRVRGDPYGAALRDHRGAALAAMFPLERVQGPLLLLAGDEDAVWDSPSQCEIAIAYLRAHQHPYPDRYVHYPHAGHAFLFATEQRPQVTFGGTARGNVEAGQRAWIEIDDFLARALAPV
jgi:dienelactone hydrolase